MSNVTLSFTPDSLELLLAALQNEQARVAQKAPDTQYALRLNGLVNQLDRHVQAARLDFTQSPL